MILTEWTNFATSTIADVGGIASGDLSVSVQPGDGALFPDPDTGKHFYVVAIKSTGAREIMKVTARSTDTFTIVRGQDNTSALAFDEDDKIELRLNSAALEEIVAYIESLMIGYYRRSQFAKKDADEIYIGGGEYEVNGKIAKITSQLTSPAISLGGNDWHYLYIDYSNIPVDGVIDNSDLYWDTDEPTWSHSKLGYYHPTATDDRWIFAVRTTADVIDGFVHNGDFVEYESGYTDFGSTLTTSYAAKTLTVPSLGGIIAQVNFGGIYVDGTGIMRFAPADKTPSGSIQNNLFQLTSYQTTGQQIMDIITDSSQQIQVKESSGGGATNNLYYINTLGWYLPKGA